MTMTVLHIASPFAVTLPEAASNSSGGLAAPTRNDTSGRGGERDDHDRGAQSLDPTGEVVIGVVSTMKDDPIVMPGSSVEAVIQAYLSLEDDAAPDNEPSNHLSESREHADGSSDQRDDRALIPPDKAR